MNSRPFPQCVFLLIFVWLTQGCTTTRELGPPGAMYPDAREELNEKAGNHAADVTLRDGQHFRSKALRVEPDRTTWLDPESGIVQTVRTDDIAEIRFKESDPQVGVPLGAVWGVMAVFAVDLTKRMFVDAGCNLAVGIGTALSGQQAGDDCPSGIGTTPYLIGGAFGALYWGLLWRRWATYTFPEQITPEPDNAVEPVTVLESRYFIRSEDREPHRRKLLYRDR